MKNLEDGENVQSMKDRVCDYLTEHYTESDDGIYLDVSSDNDRVLKYMMSL